MEGALPAVWPTRSRRIVRRVIRPWPRSSSSTCPWSAERPTRSRRRTRSVRLGVRVLVVLGGDGTDRLVASACGEVPIAALVHRYEQRVRAPRRSNGLRTGCRTPRGRGIWPSAMLADATRSSSSNIRPSSSWPWSTWRRRRRRGRCPRRLEPERGHRALRHVRRAGCRGALVDRRARPTGRTGRADRPAPRAGSRSPSTSSRPIAPGLVRQVGVASVEVMRAGDRRPITGRGVVAVDGEREIEFRDTAPTVTLSLAGPWSVEVARTMAVAARRGLLCRPGEVTIVNGMKQPPSVAEAPRRADRARDPSR